MIIGIGNDIIAVHRIEKSIKTLGDVFIKKIFTPQEIQRTKNRSKPFHGFAKIFAAKEATLKSIGIVKGISWQDIDILKNQNGQPYVRLYNNAQEKLIMAAHEKTKSLFNKKVLYEDFSIHLTITDEKEYACAFAVIELII